MPSIRHTEVRNRSILFGNVFCCRLSPIFNFSVVLAVLGPRSCKKFLISTHGFFVRVPHGTTCVLADVEDIIRRVCCLFPKINTIRQDSFEDWSSMYAPTGILRDVTQVLQEVDHSRCPRNRHLCRLSSIDPLSRTPSLLSGPGDTAQTVRRTLLVAVGSAPSIHWCPRSATVIRVLRFIYRQTKPHAVTIYK